jgi:membrane fusion protein, heavy metal efflux system
MLEKLAQRHAIAAQKRRRGRPLILVLIFGAITGVAYNYYQNKADAPQGTVAAGTNYTPETFRPTDAQWNNLRIVPVRDMPFRTAHDAEGKIVINDYKTTPVFSPFSGRVIRVLVDAGAMVNAGTPLYSIEASEFVQAQNDLVTALDTLNKTQSQFRITKINEGRQRDLYQAKGASKRDLEQAEADFISAQNDLKSAEIGLDAVRNRLVILGKTQAEVTDLVTNNTVMRPEVTVNAPISGTVISRKIGIGQYIQAAASDPVYLIGDLSTVWLIANLRETDVPFVRLGQSAEVRILAYPGRIFNAKIAYIAPSIDPATHRLPVRIEVENADLALKPEMFANFTIYSSAEATAAAISQDAIIYEGEEARVWVANPDKVISPRTIKIGRTNGVMVEITSGLKTGDSVVVGGAIFIDRAVRGDNSDPSSEPQRG